jgi:hypothetical protein
MSDTPPNTPTDRDQVPDDAYVAPDGAQVVDDPDEPVHPDAGTRAEVEAAQAALHAPASARRPYRAPRSMLYLALVIAGVLGLGIYAVVWSDHLRVKNEKIELRELQRRHVMSGWQQKGLILRFGPNPNVQPSGVVYKPLTPAEATRYDALLKQHGTQFEPNDVERDVIEDVRRLEAVFAAATQPAAGPAGQP